MDIGQNQSEYAPFELVMQQRHPKDVYDKETGELVIEAGTPTGRTLTKKAGTGAEIADFWNKNKYLNKKRRKRKPQKKERLPQGKEATKLLDKVNEYAEKMAKERNDNIQ